jgi:hypothetical protein
VLQASPEVAMESDERFLLTFGRLKLVSVHSVRVDLAATLDDAADVKVGPTTRESTLNQGFIVISAQPKSRKRGRVEAKVCQCASG